MFRELLYKWMDLLGSKWHDDPELQGLAIVLFFLLLACVGGCITAFISFINEAKDRKGSQWKWQRGEIIGITYHPESLLSCDGYWLQVYASTPPYNGGYRFFVSIPDYLNSVHRFKAGESINFQLRIGRITNKVIEKKLAF